MIDRAVALDRIARAIAHEDETIEKPEGFEVAPRLAHPARGEHRAVALMLHGGEPEGLDPSAETVVSAAIMRLWSAQLHRRLRDVAFVRLMNSVDGWNGRIASPVADAEWALMRVRQLYPHQPIVLVGHSMGGRTAFELAEHPDVTSIVALAPWLADGYVEQRFLDTPLLVVHGRQDTVTSPEASRDLVERINSAGGDARLVSVPGWHALALQRRRWQKQVAGFVQRTTTPSRG